MKFSNKITLQELRNKRKQKGIILFIGFLLTSAITALAITFIPKTSGSIGPTILLGVISLIAALVLFILAVAYFSGNTKYSLDKLLKQPDSKLELPQYEEEFNRAKQITPNIYMSNHYIFSNGGMGRITIIPIKKLLLLY